MGNTRDKGGITMKKHYRFWMQAVSLVFVGLLAVLWPDWGLELRAQTLSSTSVNFGNVPVGTTSSRTVTFTNTDEFELLIASITAGGGFSTTDNCPRGQGQLTVGSSCTITVSFSPVAPGNQTGTLTVAWRRFACEFDSEGSTSATLSGVGVAAIDAVDDTATTDAGTPVTIDVLLNDTPRVGLTLVQVSDPPNGSATISGNAVVYTPDAGFAGTDTFTYIVRDRFQQTATATVTVTVRPPGLNAVDDTATTQAGRPATINVLANDTGEGLTLVQVSDPPNGSATRSGNAVVYTPRAGFTGTDTFTYTVVDDFERTDEARVTVTVRPPGLNAVNDTATTQAGNPVTITVLVNDTGEGLTLIQVSDPPNGSAAINGGTVVYTPDAGFTGTDAFTYTIRDRFGQTDTATVRVTVRPPGLNAVDDTATTPARTPVTIPVLANDAGEGLTLIQVSDPPNGSAAISGSAITYTPAPTFVGSDSFTYTLRDRFGQTDTAAVRVTVIAPTLNAVDDTASARTRTPVVIPVLANDVGTGLTITQVGAPGHGTAVAGADGTITYTSAANFTGTDAFNYTITDGIGTDSAVVTVTVTRNKEDTQRLLEDSTDNPNEQAVGRTIGGLCFDRAASANFLRDCGDLIDAASNGDPGVGPALAQITPMALGTAVDTAQTSAQTQMLNIRSRMISLRTGVMGIDLERLNIQRGGWTLSGRDLRYLLASLEGGGPGAEVDTHLGAFGVFASGTLNLGDREGTENQAGFDFKTREVTVGADYRFSDQFVLGAALSYTAVDTDIDGDGGHLDTRGYGLTLYGTYYPSDRFYVDGMVNYGWNDYDQQRNVSYQVQDTDVNQRFDSDYGGRQLFAEVGTGYEFTRGPLSFGPEARLSYLDVQVDEFRERAADSNPGSAWAVAIDEQELQSLTLSLGGRARYLIDQPWGVLQPQLELSWLHEFNDDSRVVRGRFVEGAVVPDNLFQLAADPVDKDYFRLGLGLLARFNRGPSALIQYRTLFDYANLEEHSISAELRWEF